MDTMIVAELEALSSAHPEMAEPLSRAVSVLRAQIARAANMRALLDISVQLNSTRDYQTLLRLILDRACALLHAEAASIFRVEPETGDLQMALATTIPPEVASTIRVPRGEGIVGKSVACGETVFVPDVSQDPAFFGKVDSTTSFVTRSILCTPLRIHEVTLHREDDEQTSARITGAVEVLNKIDGQFTQDDIEMFEGLAVQIAVALNTLTLYQELQTTFLGVASAMAASIDAKDNYTHGHSARVTEFSTAIGYEMGFSADEIANLRFCAVLHDVGKIGIPDSVLNKAQQLSDAEYEIIKQHTQIGYEIMSKVPAFLDVARALREHHERLDGTGYPDQLTNGAISVFARVLAVADAFDAMTSNRVYRPALTVEEAFRRLREAAGRHFAPEVVAAMEAAYAHGKIIPAHAPPAPEKLSAKSG